jgi:hypothetical protein
MKVYFPLADGQTIPNSVLCSLTNQSMPVDIVPCVTTGTLETNRAVKDLKCKLTSELASRNKALHYIKQSGEEFVVMQDRDTVHLDRDNLLNAHCYMKRNPDAGIISLPWKPYKVTDHIRMMCLMIRVSLIKDFSFTLDNRWHMCKNMAEDAARLGFKCEFLDSKRELVYEIEADK